MNKKISPKVISLVFGVLVICFAIGFYALAVWTEPTKAPPGGNVDAPVNVGGVGQYKSGPLRIGGVFRTDSETVLAVLGGNVGIGTTQPRAGLDVINSVIIGTGSMPSAAKEGGRIRMEDGYFTGEPADRDALVIEKVDDDTYVEGGMVFGFATSTADNTNDPFLADGSVNPNWGVNHTPVMTIRGTGSYPNMIGNVGIGTAGPKAKFSVSSSDNDMLNIYSPADNTLAIQTTLDNQPLGTYGGDAQNRLILQPLVGNVGIGTTNPGTNKLEVVGGPIKATGGLIIETRNSDPGAPATGQMWLRTDINP